jgi:predicted Zn-dependent protease
VEIKSIERCLGARGRRLGFAGGCVLGLLLSMAGAARATVHLAPASSHGHSSGRCLVADHPHGPPLAAHPPPEARYLEEAKTHLRGGQPRKAVTALERGLLRYPRSAPLHYAAARILAQEGEVTRARVHYQRVVALAPQMVGGYFGLAQVAFEQQDYKASAAALESALTRSWAGSTRRRSRRRKRSRHSGRP